MMNLKSILNAEIGSGEVYTNPAYHTALRLNDCNTIYTSKAR